MKTFIYTMFLILNFNGIAQNPSAFEKGNTFYNNGQYNEAIEQYQSIIKTGKHSAEVYFNLGNAYYKLNHVAPSIYNYEKALQLAPNDKDIKNNISFARNMTIDAIDVLPEVGFSKLTKNTINILTFNNWAKLSVALVILFVILFLMYYFSFSTTQKRLSFVGSFIVLFLAIIALVFAFQKYNLTQNNHPAIVFSKESRVMSDPNKTSSEAFRLHEGTKVQVLEAYDNWNKIKLSDGKIGWIPSQDIKEL